MSILPGLSATDIANMRQMQRDVTVTMNGALMVDECQRLEEVLQVDEDGREIEPTYEPREIYPCRFSWGRSGDGDRADKSAEGVAEASPTARVPEGATFTANDHFRLRKRYGQLLDPMLEFVIDGEPQLELGYVVLELKRVTT